MPVFQRRRIAELLLLCTFCMAVTACDEQEQAASSSPRPSSAQPATDGQMAGMPSAVPIFRVAEEDQVVLTFTELLPTREYDVLYEGVGTAGQPLNKEDTDKLLGPATETWDTSESNGEMKVTFEAAPDSKDHHLNVTVRLRNTTANESSPKVVCIY